MASFGAGPLSNGSGPGFGARFLQSSTGTRPNGSGNQGFGPRNSGNRGGFRFARGNRRGKNIAAQQHLPRAHRFQGPAQQAGFPFNGRRHNLPRGNRRPRPMFPRYHGRRGRRAPNGPCDGDMMIEAPALIQAGIDEQDVDMQEAPPLVYPVVDPLVARVQDLSLNCPIQTEYLVREEIAMQKRASSMLKYAFKWLPGVSTGVKDPGSVVLGKSRPGKPNDRSGPRPRHLTSNINYKL